MNNQKNKNQGKDDRSGKSKQQPDKGVQSGTQKSSQSGKQEGYSRPKNAPSQSSPRQPGDKPMRPVEGGDEGTKSIGNGSREGKNKREETAF